MLGLNSGRSVCTSNLYGKRMTILTIVVAIGFLGCCYFLRQIVTLLVRCSVGLSELNSTADDINKVLGPLSVTLDDLKQHIEERFPIHEPTDPLL